MNISKELQKIVDPSNECCCEHCISNKCKEWAYKQGYSIVDGIDTIGNKICYIMKCTGFAVDYYYEQTINYVDVFQACQWILENK